MSYGDEQPKVQPIQYHKEDSDICIEEQSSQKPIFQFEPVHDKDSVEEKNRSFQAFHEKRKQFLSSREQNITHIEQHNSEVSNRSQGLMKNLGSNKYKGKKPLLDKSPGFSLITTNQGTSRRTYGYGELPQEESPSFRESNFNHSKREVQYEDEDQIVLDEPSEEPK